MSCDCEVKNAGFVVVRKGEDASLTFFCVKQTGRPFPLTGATELTMKFKNADGTDLTKTMTGLGISLVNAGAGEFAVSITDTESALLKAVDRVDVQLIADFGTTRRIINFEKAITVK